MTHDDYPDAFIRKVLTGTKTIALLGASAKENRPSFFVLKYLLARGYRMLPVNPGLAGQQIAGCEVFASLADIAEPIDMVDMFRNASYAPDVLDEMLALPVRPKVLWMQLGVRDDATAARAEENGIAVVMNRCPKIEYGRLSSEISWMGVNSRTLSSKRPPAPAGGQRLSLGRITTAGGGLAQKPGDATEDDRS
ncbi:O-acetylhomoserine sulfhydrylase [Rhodovulum sp. PH10]|uniref:CoA-binding protein n=1 Tax=Rhodovulum sp. PH10 TaxID=1187851 RepID=UPI00027C2C93|nr:CoA-binding protein [Rhodovulum sp. PH10]EJW10059.1 O-acetylhomoserine sulfhydrylase [Rhodovulum sp. PH10]